MMTNTARKFATQPPKSFDWRNADDHTLRDGLLAGIDGAWKEVTRRFGPKLRATIYAVLKKYGRVMSNDSRKDIELDFYLSLLANDMKKLRVWDPAKGRQLGSWLSLLICQTALNEVRRVVNRPQQIDLDEILHIEDFAAEEDESQDGDESQFTRQCRYDVADAQSWWQSPRTAKRKAA